MERKKEVKSRVIIFGKLQADLKYWENQHEGKKVK